MRVIALLGLCFVAVTAIPRSPSRIAGGNFVTIDKYPSSASILQTWDGIHHTFTCGGVIINNRSILTAGHCIYYFPSQAFRIRVGSSYGTTGGVVLPVARQMNYPGYNDDSYDFDIALLQTATFINFNNNVKASPVAGSLYHLADNQAVWATGWQNTEGTAAAEISTRQLSDSQIFTVNGDFCHARYESTNNLITPEMLCTGWPKQDYSGQCVGVFGAGVFHSDVLVGITSQCLPSLPTVNTRVSSYVSWIQSNA